MDHTNCSTCCSSTATLVTNCTCGRDRTASGNPAYHPDSDTHKNARTNSIPLEAVSVAVDADYLTKKLSDNESITSSEPAPSYEGFLGYYELYRDFVFQFIKRNKAVFVYILLGTLLGAYIGYLTYVCVKNFERAQYLLWGTVAVVGLVIYFKLVKPVLVASPYYLAMKSGLKEGFTENIQKWARIGLLLAFVIGMGIFLGIDAYHDPLRLRALAGMATFILLGILLSNSPGHINWRIVAAGIAVQFVFGLIVLRWDTGKLIFEKLGDFLQWILLFANEGSKFVFSPGEDQHRMAFMVMPVLLFASFLIAILYHIGAMGWFVEKVGWVIYLCLGTTAAESISAAANVFLGQTEAPLTIKPYIPLLTVSELMAVMSGGFATISGSLMATYATMGVEAKNLLAASVMNAPSALVMAKLLYPERQKSKTDFKNMKRDKGTAYNVLDAAMMAATNSVQAIAGILAMLICATAFLKLVDAVLSFLGGLADVQDLTLAMISGYVFWPIAFLMGVDQQECYTIGQLLGFKTFINEFVAYEQLGKLATPLSNKGKIIATYALCGFANFASVGIQLANFSIMAPTRKKDITRLVLRALFAGFTANMLTASMAGLLIPESESGTVVNLNNTSQNSSLMNFHTSFHLAF
ncbi:uncharacterized transporter YutK-like [Paramacrobiotus metropolitanus]|uniref:uncharacterized transporter YutK-like n=1 Tax=Paramacrobiotus metropolitanus TaxID=2943436 RepID=UPI0024464CC2|nr:uncharacterized transporter YutK-like [Paramacrobiotus metropolitanus]